MINNKSYSNKSRLISKHSQSHLSTTLQVYLDIACKGRKIPLDPLNATLLKIADYLNIVAKKQNQDQDHATKKNTILKNHAI